MSKKTNPIAVFDSGVGGISVLRELVKILPNEDYIYYGDSKNAPYGMKDKETVKQLTINAAEYLFAQGAKGLVVACNTATSAAVRALRELYPDIPIVGIEPAVKPAATLKPNCRVLVMATPMTIGEEPMWMYASNNSTTLFKLSNLGYDLVWVLSASGAHNRRQPTHTLSPYLAEFADLMTTMCRHATL